jgi:hypothetical protein
MRATVEHLRGMTEGHERWFFAPVVWIGLIAVAIFGIFVRGWLYRRFATWVADLTWRIAVKPSWSFAYAWEGIETAPRDGTQVMVLIEPRGIMHVARYCDQGWGVSDGPLLQGVTHWQPLPDMPAPDYADEITSEQLEAIRNRIDPDGTRAKRRTLISSNDLTAIP